MKKIVLINILIAVLALLCVMSYLQGRMNGIRADYNLTDATPLENAPPIVAFSSVALGGFRGLLADYLWLRSVQMQEEGKYFEMVQLADWIVKLQPRYTMSHAHLAWNMAYNVSVTFTDPSDRWRWVKRGLELIRDEALEYNPQDPELYRQLSLMYGNKMGKYLDSNNRFYKSEMAKEMIRLFGDYYGRWEEIDRAPLNVTKLRAMLDDKAAIFDQALAEQGMQFADLEHQFRLLSALPAELDKVFTREGIKEDVEMCLRHRWILYKYRLDPKMIMKLNEKYGPLDWRLPQAHAIYWAELGLEQWQEANEPFKRLQCQKTIYQALKDAFELGKLLYLRENYNVLEMMPNLALADATYEAYVQTIKDNPEISVHGALVNYLAVGTCDLYKFGRKKEAQSYYDKGRAMNPGRFSGGIEAFVAREIEAALDTHLVVNAQSMIQSCIYQGYYYMAFAPDENSEEYEEAMALLENGKMIWTIFQKKVGKEGKRIGLPPFEQMVKSTLTYILAQMEGSGTTAGNDLARNLLQYVERPTEENVLKGSELEASEVR